MSRFRSVMEASNQFSKTRILENTANPMVYSPCFGNCLACCRGSAQEGCSFGKELVLVVLVSAVSGVGDPRVDLAMTVSGKKTF